MKTLSIHKNKALSAAEAVGKWWKSKNVFFSMLAEENLTNKEVVLVHLILIAFLIGTAFVETKYIISIVAVITSVICAKHLNNPSKRNSNINS